MKLSLYVMSHFSSLSLQHKVTLLVFSVGFVLPGSLPAVSILPGGRRQELKQKYWRGQPEAGSGSGLWRQPGSWERQGSDGRRSRRSGRRGGGSPGPGLAQRQCARGARCGLPGLQSPCARQRVQVRSNVLVTFSNNLVQL